MLTIRLPEEIEVRLANLATQTGRSKSFIVREAILEHLNEMEDVYLAIDRLEKNGNRWGFEQIEQDSDLDS
jgi:RHH-type transcriptional regulator, rel operon repressor / antitoxin RelB